MRGKILVLLVCIAMLVGVLSGCTETKVEANKLPNASFTHDLLTGIYVGTEISFTDASTDEDGTIASWDWNFGDEATSTEQNPMHTYDAVGTYTVTLIVTDDDGNASEPFTMDIEVTNVPPSADFTYEPMVNLTVNMTITFTDVSIEGDANITTWFWDFGDGTNSTEQNPEHMYTAVGDYAVTLKVTDANELSNTTDPVTIEVTEEA
jgi:PKD repeat protein